MKGMSVMLGKLSGFFSGISGGSTSVGLSIGTSSIKLVELKNSGKERKLLHFGTIQLPEDAIVNREIVNHIAVVDSLKTLVNQIRLKSKRVCISLSGTSVILKRMSLEVQDMKELQEQVFWEAEQYLPFDVSEVVMDFQVLSKSADGRVDIILVAVKKSVLESFMGCVTDAGLKPQVVDVDFFALENLVEANYPMNSSEAVAIADIGASSLKLAIIHNGMPVFTKDTAIGGRNLTAEIQKHLDLSYEDAEMLKIGGQSQGTPQEVNDLLQVMSENLATEIKRSLDFYNASSSGAPVSYVLLAGGCAKIQMISKTVEGSIGLPVQVINPFNAISYDPAVFKPEYIEAISPVAAVPVGLALRMGNE